MSSSVIVKNLVALDLCANKLQDADTDVVFEPFTGMGYSLQTMKNMDLLGEITAIFWRAAQAEQRWETAVWRFNSETQLPLPDNRVFRLIPIDILGQASIAGVAVQKGKVIPVDGIVTIKPSLTCIVLWHEKAKS